MNRFVAVISVLCLWIGLIAGCASTPSGEGDAENAQHGGLAEETGPSSMAERHGGTSKNNGVSSQGSLDHPRPNEYPRMRDSAYEYGSERAGRIQGEGQEKDFRESLAEGQPDGLTEEQGAPARDFGQAQPQSELSRARVSGYRQGPGHGGMMREAEQERRFRQDQDSRERVFRRAHPYEPVPRQDSYRTYGGSRPPRSY